MCAPESLPAFSIPVPVAIPASTSAGPRPPVGSDLPSSPHVFDLPHYSPISSYDEEEEELLAEVEDEEEFVEEGQQKSDEEDEEAVYLEEDEEEEENEEEEWHMGGKWRQMKVITCLVQSTGNSVDKIKSTHK